MTELPYDVWMLNEGEGGRVPSNDAIAKLYKLLLRLEDGVSLLVFCVRPRVQGSTRINWTLFYEIICQKKVPIVIVVTGLENEDSMDSWWDNDENWDEFCKRELQPVGHACITATKGKLRRNGRHVFHEEYNKSIAKVKTLIQRHHKDFPWQVKKVEWLRNIYETTYHSRKFRDPEKRQKLVATVSESADKLVEAGMSREDATILTKLLDRT